MDEDCLKLTAYLAERRRTGDAFVSDVLLNLYERHRIAASIVLRCFPGSFGCPLGKLHRGGQETHVGLGSLAAKAAELTGPGAA